MNEWRAPFQGNPLFWPVRELVKEGGYEEGGLEKVAWNWLGTGTLTVAPQSGAISVLHFPDPEPLAEGGYR